MHDPPVSTPIASGLTASDSPEARALNGPCDSRTSELTLRALITGMLLAAAFSAVNLYLGFRVGLGINLSIPSALIAFFGCRAVGLVSPRVRPFHILEVNIAQTAASAGAAVAAAGLVTVLPTLTILTGRTLGWAVLTLWILAVSALGVTAAVIVRRPLVEREDLPFAVGVATAELLRGLYARGREAARSLGTLVAAGIASAVISVCGMHSPRVLGVRIPVDQLLAPLPIPFPIRGMPASSLGWSFSNSPLYYAIGALLGLRVAASILLGSLIAFVVLPSYAAGQGHVAWPPVVKDIMSWVSWPGVAALVVTSLVALAAAWPRSIWQPSGSSSNARQTTLRGNRSLVAMGLLVIVLVTVLQTAWFGVSFFAALVATALAFVLALIAARITAEVALTPSGPLGKVSQLVLGALQPRVVEPNLMAANVAGGAASQCAELIHDLKCGAILGASWRAQTLAQLSGVLAGAAAGSALYLTLFSDPAKQLLTDEFPAPAVRALSGVAQLVQSGAAAVPAGAAAMMWIVGGAALLLAIAEAFAPARVRRLLPSAVSAGFGFVVPPSLSLAVLLGAIAAALIQATNKSARQWVIVASIGVVLGDAFMHLAAVQWIRPA